jgi:hypothetical protein
MKYWYWLMMLLITTGIFISCKKTNSNNANVLFYNGTWSLPAITAAWNESPVITTAVAQAQSSGTADKPYLQLPAGTNLITLKAGTDALVNNNIYTAATGGNSFLFFDTSTTKAPVRILQLIDDLTQPDTAEIKYRFLNLSPDSSLTADVWLVNGSTDSIQLSVQGAFVGKEALAVSLATFTAIKYHGQTYTIKIKKAGTGQVFASVAGYIFAVRNSYSIIFSGLSNGTGNAGLKLSVLHHQTQ